MSLFAGRYSVHGGGGEHAAHTRRRGHFIPESAVADFGFSLPRYITIVEMTAAVEGVGGESFDISLVRVS